MLKRIYFILIFLGSVTPVFSVTVSGKITDEKNLVLPFVNVFIEGTTIGTTSNISGDYSIEMKPGEYNLVFRMIGYRQHVEKIVVANTSITLNIGLIPEAYQLKEVSVNASAEDPAYEIIRNAQKKRKQYLHEVKEYACDAYVKSTQRITSYPKKFLGQEVDLSEILDTSTGIVYLSESISKLYFREPDKTKEVMVSSKVSGNNRSFSFNQASDLMFNFYENLIQINGVSRRGFVSPVSASAMFYYRYRLEGTFFENGVTVNKIKVIPKRSTDPVFQGDIYILDDSWRIHSTDLFITRDQQVEFIDTLQIHQAYVPVEKNTWMNFSNQLTYSFVGFGFHVKGVVLGINSNYNITPGLGSHFFDGEVMKINADANKKDSLYWLATRPVPLIAEEVKDYHKRDSATVVHESKAFRDSMDKKNNKFSVSGLLLTGYSFEKSYQKETYSFSPLISNVQFNTVEGLNIGVNADYTKQFQEDIWSQVAYGTTLRYGFSNDHFNASAFYQRRYRPHKPASFELTLGTEVTQFNAGNPITELLNSGYSLFGEKNYLKLYERRFISAEEQMELINGLQLETNVEYANRLPLLNTTDYSFTDVQDRKYTSNDPQHPETDSLHFEENQSLSFDIGLRIRFSQQYMNRPEGKIVLGSDYPNLRIHYRKGLKNLVGSDVDYDFVSLDVRHRIRLGLLGSLRGLVSAGKFLNTHQVYFMDYKHFNGNRTFISSFRLNDFKLLDYYQFSTTGSYLEAHAEQNFGGFFLNKIPLIRKLKFNEVGGVHYLHTETMKNYFEFSIGIEKLNIFRIDFVTSFAESKKLTTGIILGIKGVF